MVSGLAALMIFCGAQSPGGDPVSTSVAFG